MKFYSKPIEEHAEVPLADDGQFEELVQSWERRERRTDNQNTKINKCYVVSLGAEDDLRGQMAEILSLVKTQGDQIVGREMVKLLKPNPRSVIGKGRLQEIAQRVEECGANLMVVDAELSPSQMRNLEEITGVAICDREAVILNVFMKNARTRRSKIQVEVAQLEYLRPRIRGMGLDMDQQASSIVTGRGPGETASALLARKLDGRLLELKRALSKIKTSGVTQRKSRESCKRIALVGYTNAGKTSLMNALAGTNLSAKNKPFETLDTTTRRLSCHGPDVLLSDTVGFIRRLPDRLLESFESTLEGIKKSSLLVVVVDISDKEKALHLATTQALLLKLGVERIPRLYVFNKTDLQDVQVSKDELDALCRGNKHISINCHDLNTIKALRETLLSEVHSEKKIVHTFVPYTASRALSLIYANCLVAKIDERPDGLLFTLEVDAKTLGQIKKLIKEVCHE